MDYTTFIDEIARLPLLPPPIVMLVTNLGERLSDAKREELIIMLIKEYTKFEQNSKHMQAFEQDSLAELKRLKQTYLQGEMAKSVQEEEKAEAQLAV